MSRYVNLSRRIVDEASSVGTAPKRPVYLFARERLAGTNAEETWGQPHAARVLECIPRREDMLDISAIGSR